MGTADPLQTYRAKRDFKATPEPGPRKARRRKAEALSFVVQKHDATRLHYDFRLELDGVLLSWAVPKGPSLDPADKRMAVRTEDHPLAYAGFEGRIPEGHYGAGTVIVWDRGTWTPLDDPHAGLASGKLAFELHGHKLRGAFELVRMKDARGKQAAWLLFKKRDGQARPRAEFDVVREQPDSVRGEADPAPARAPGADNGGAVAAPLPATLAPQLASAAEVSDALLQRLDAAGWTLETKFDGYRVLARLQRGQVRLFTRNGHDWTDRMPELAQALRAIPVDSAWLDGEIMVPGAHGGADFNALQNVFERGARARSARIVYWLFDLPYFEGHDLRDAPLYARRTLLRELLAQHVPPDAPLRFSADLRGPAARALHDACTRGLEGVIAKQRDAPYRSTRSEAWLKLKCQRRQEFVVGGYTLRQDDRQAIGSLVLGVYDKGGDKDGGDGVLKPAGSVGTGFDRATARALRTQLEPLRRRTTPFTGALPPSRRRAAAAAPQWVEPEMVVEVEFGEWTPAGHIRHASFVGRREDKPARAIRREESVMPKTLAAAAAAAPKPAGTLAGVRVTHGERVVDAKSGLTKLDLLRYYDSVAERMLPHLRGRAVALLRAPAGVGGETFFQKHLQAATMPGVRVLDASLWPGHEALLEIDSRAGLLGAAQMNVIEFHTWNSRTRSMGKPDRMVFDLDPGEGVAWPAMREGAQLVRALLTELGLQAWLKTSGGKGLHVVVPLAARWDFDTVKGFSQAVVQHLAKTVPQRFVAKSGPANRVGRIFVDYLRNGLGATTVAAFSARARPGLGVSMPLPWDALPALKRSDQWSVADAREHLSFETADPWADVAAARQSLVQPMKRLGYRAG